jgi:hypothetical protein
VRCATELVLGQVRYGDGGRCGGSARSGGGKKEKAVAEFQSMVRCATKKVVLLLLPCFFPLLFVDNGIRGIEIADVRLELMQGVN